MRPFLALLLAGALATVPGASAAGQDLTQRIGRAPADANLSFSFPARDGVCGGSHFVRYGTSVTVSRGSYFTSGDSESHPCSAGPVRVTLLRAGGQVVGLEVGVGADDSGRPIQDLGTVTGAAAAEYLLSLAATVEGRPGQAAILPAMLAADAAPVPALQALAQNRDLSRQTRTSAATWLGRELEMLPAAQGGALVEALARMARDETDAPAVRQHAMTVLGRGPQGPGIPALIGLAGSPDPWVARTATAALAGSGDPRARAHLRTAARAPDRPDGVRAAALRGLGRSYATAQDLTLLKEVFPGLATSAEREAVLAAVGAAGGAPNVRWLIDIARGATASATATRALRAAAQAGATSADLASLYDTLTDRAPRSTIIGLLAERGDRTATDKLLAIARGDTDVSLRRSAIQRLSNSSDPRVKAALGELVGR
jgi:hypothetical protein